MIHGYAISGTMSNGNILLKRDNIPRGNRSGNAIIPGEDVSYKDKVYDSNI